MKKRLTALLLCLTLLGSPAALAAGRSGPFTPALIYDGRFTDVGEEDWFYPHVAALYALGLTRGKTADLFGVYDEISVKEVVGFAARLRSLYFYGDAERGALPFSREGTEEELWYMPYVLYLKSEGVLDAAFDGRMDHTATRAQTARIAARALPEDFFTPINDAAVSVGYATRAFIPDVTDYTPYQQDILRLYRWGVVTGSDEAGRFCPEDPITRGEFSALLTRLADPSLRVTLNWDTSARYSAEFRTYASLVRPGAYCRAHSLYDLSAIDSNVRFMLAGGGSAITLRLTEANVTEATAAALMENYLNAIRQYIEQGYNAVFCSYDGGANQVTLRFYSSLFSDAAFASARSQTLAEAIRVHDRLWAQGAIRADMTQREKALVYYTYLCNNCAYDYQATMSSLSHSAYSLFVNHTAVCDGYTAAYNLLLKLEGIDCSTCSMDSENHIWTVATLDGTSCHIDVTWGDSEEGTIHYEYFGMTEAQALFRF